MIVQGVQIPVSIVMALTLHIQGSDEFSFRSLVGEAQRELKRCDLDTSIADRLADRYLQRARSAGTIHYKNGKWELAR